MNNTEEKEITKQISIITLAILIAFCSSLFKCTYTNNMDALNYHKAVEVCKNDTVCIKCYVVANSASESIKHCVQAK